VLDEIADAEELAEEIDYVDVDAWTVLGCE
jgi:hypothetical protein